MALLYQAELRPTKLELLAGWAPTQSWFEGDQSADPARVGSFRFDDPEGEVGIETLLVRYGDGPVLQVPLTYRAAPFDGGAAWLIGTLQHSVLGERWVYDATGDPSYLAAVTTVIRSGGRHADEYLQVDDDQVFREPTAAVAGTGTATADGPVAPPPVDTVTTQHEQRTTLSEADGLRLVVVRVLPDDQSPARHRGEPADGVDTPALTGTWPGRSEPCTLAFVTAG